LLKLSKRGPIVVFIADLNRSCSAEKECHLSLLEQTKIDRAKNDQSFKIRKTLKAKISGRAMITVLLQYHKSRGASRTVRPILAAYQNFYHFFRLSLIFFFFFGNSQGFQPAKPNVFISHFTFYFY
jgi:hypothetical protein